MFSFKGVEQILRSLLDCWTLHGQAELRTAKKQLVDFAQASHYGRLTHFLADWQKRVFPNPQTCASSKEQRVTSATFFPLTNYLTSSLWNACPALNYSETDAHMLHRVRPYQTNNVKSMSWNNCTPFPEYSEAVSKTTMHFTKAIISMYSPPWSSPGTSWSPN